MNDKPRRREPDPAIVAAHGLGKADEPVREMPANVEAEQAILGSILNDNRCLDRVSAFLEDEHFFEKLHSKIYFVCGELIRSGKPATPISVHTFLPAKGTFADMTMIQYLARLASDATGAFAVRENAIAVHEAFLARQAISAATDFLDFAFDPPPGVDIIGERTDLEDRLAQLRGLRVKSENRIGMGRSYLNDLDAARKRGDIKGIPIVLPEIRRVLNSPKFVFGRLYGMLGSSGEGKTSIMCQIIVHALENGHPVQLHSFDQSKGEIIQQMIAQAHDMENRRQAEGDISASEWGKAQEFGAWIDEQPFEILEIESATAPQLVTYARSFARKTQGYGGPLILTDYVNAVSATEELGFKRRNGQDTEGTKAKAINKILKGGARSIGASWLNLSQRNTEGMKRDNPKPIAADVYGGQSALYSYDALFYIYRFMKFYKEAKQTAAFKGDHAKIASIFPTAVQQGEDIVEIGALKVRFGAPYQEPEQVRFSGRFTRYESLTPAVDQEELSFLRAVS